MGSESEESESSGFGGQRLGQDVVNLKTAEKFLLVGVTVRRHIELFSFHADFQNAAQPGAVYYYLIDNSTYVEAPETEAETTEAENILEEKETAAEESESSSAAN